MQLIYAFLGWGSVLSERLSHTRINFITLNLIFAFLAYAATAAAVSSALNAFSEGSLVGGISLTLVSIPLGLLALALAIPMLTLYIIFRKRGTADLAKVTPYAPSDGTEPLAVLATGKFTLPGSHTQRFLGIPSLVGLGEGNEITVISRADASSHLMGFRINKREGLWGIGINPASVPEFQYGEHYYGATPYPALRFDYIERFRPNPQGKPLTQAQRIDSFGATEGIILAFESEVAREQFLGFCKNIMVEEKVRV